MDGEAVSDKRDTKDLTRIASSLTTGRKEGDLLGIELAANPLTMPMAYGMQPSEVRPMSRISEQNGGEVVTNPNPHDGFNVEDEMPPSEWADFGFDHYGEYIHLVPDPEAHELRCYRSISEPGEDNKRIKTTIERVNFVYHYDDEEEHTLNYFYLTSQQAESFLTFLNLLGEGRESSVGFSWWEESGMTMMEGERTKIETINLRFTKPNGVERRLQIQNAWQSPRSHRMASLEGEVL